jgi:uncharacterized protein YjbI with pentapeptide repeats
LVNRCSYTREYYDRELKGNKIYECPEVQYSEEGLCKFHLEKYASNSRNKEEIIDLLRKKIVEANAAKSPLKWIGYQIPAGIAFPNELGFKVDVYLSYANFLGDADFRSSIFERDVIFDDTTFNGITYFSNAVFNGKAYLYKTTFSRDADFTEATFNSEADFSYAVFNGKAFFPRVIFNGETYYFVATFNSEADFSYAVFNGETQFFKPSFNEGMSFNDTEFNKEAEFDFPNEPILGFFRFHYVTLKEQEKILFNGDLSKVSFANTEITRVRFGDKVVWGKKKDESGIEFKIFDEYLMEMAADMDQESPNSLEAVVTEYRNLRENYEYNLRYEEAGQFFKREMEMRRKYKQMTAANNKIMKKKIGHIFSFAFLYSIVADYGESTRKPLIITTSIFALATLYFWSRKVWTMDTSAQNTTSSDTIDPVSDSISRTLTAFFPFFNLPNDSGLLEMILRATMIPLAGLLFITLRRKLERRFRH